MSAFLSIRRRWRSVVLAGLLALGLVLPAAAQDKEPPMPPRPPVPAPPAPQVTVELHQVEAVVKGPVATVHVTQVLRNDSERNAEGVYLFPLPVDAAVSDFQMTVNGETVEGKLMSREEARNIYDEIVRRQRDPALLEYAGRGLFQANVFPIPPGETRKLEFTYMQVLDLKNGLYRFNYPLRTRQLSTLPVEQVSVSVELVDQPGLRTLYSPNYPVRIDKNSDDSALVTFKSANSQPDSDLDLYFGVDKKEIGLNLLSYRPKGEDGYFVLLAAPSVEAADDQIVARDLVLVVDVSGSMQGEKIKQAQAAARFVVEHLNPGDRFNVIAFSSATDAWENKLQTAGDKTVKDVGRWIDRLRATGSTDINRALLEALAQFDANAGEQDNTRPAYVLFLTDGQPTLGETEPGRIVDNANNNKPAERSVRLFTFGIGYDVNTDLLDVLSQDLGGRSSYVAPGERVDEAVSSFYAQISTPVLSDVKIDLGENIEIADTYPYPAPDMFAGEQQVLVGRYREGGETTVELSGNVNGKQRLYVYPGQILVKAGGDSFVARLWATRKIGALLEQIRRNGTDQELVDSIVQLSLRYGIVTPYTSYLVEEPASVPVAEGATSANATPPMPRALAADAYNAVEAAAGQAAAAAVGAAAVQASKTRDELQRATTVGQHEETIRYIDGKTFKRQGIVEGAEGASLEFWVDTEFDDTMKVTTIEFGSDDYWKLLDQPEMASWLALSKEVIVTGEGAALRITTLPMK